MEERFELEAKRIFSQFGDPAQRAAEDAMMMWLAWRGDESYLQALLSDQLGSESSWRFCRYSDVEGLITRFKHVEVRPIVPPFADHVLARLAVLVQKRVAEDRGAEVYRVTPDGIPEVGGERNAIDEVYRHAKEGFDVVADWPKEPHGILKRRTMSLSSRRFLYLDFVHPRKGGQTNSRGFMYVLSGKERASSRLRRRSLIRWILTG